MVLILIAVAFILALNGLGHFNYVILTDWLEQLQLLCSQGFSSSMHREVLAGLVCGQTPATRQVVTDWAVTGLLPIFVGAGTHFLFLEQFLNRLLGKFPKLLTGSLFLFVCVTGFCAALTRSLISQKLQDFNRRYKLGLSVWQIWLLTLFICYALQPQWLLNLGFCISAGCVLFISLSHRLGHSRGLTARLRSLTLMYLGLIPLFAFLGLPLLHPFTMVITFVVTPLAGFVLFPIGLLERFFIGLQPQLDPLWTLMTKSLHELVRILPQATPHRLPQNPVLVWSYLLSVWALLVLIDLSGRAKLRYRLVQASSPSNVRTIFPLGRACIPFGDLVRQARSKRIRRRRSNL